MAKNKIFRGFKASYQVLETLKDPSVFKARALNPSAQDFVILKQVVFERELSNHRLPGVLASPYIRQLRDIVDPDVDQDIQEPRLWEPKNPKNCMMVLDWMDTTLWDARPFGVLQNRALPRAVARSVLEALAVFEDIHGAHTDISPNNVLISNIDDPNPVVKVADLGQAVTEGIKKPRAQTLETRAPEVWRGLGVWPVSDTWSLGVTMIHWLMSRPLFGISGKVIEGEAEAWSLAKLRRLVGPFGDPEDQAYVDEFSLAAWLEQEYVVVPETMEKLRPFILEKPLREELEQVPDEVCSKECKDFILYLMEVDWRKRPTPRQALEHAFVK